MYTNQQLYDAIENFCGTIPIKKATFDKADVPQSVLCEMIDAMEVLDGYKEDFPAELLKSIQNMALKALKNIYKGNKPC